MEKNNELVKRLQHGDYERLADMTGFSKVYVCQVIHGRRNNAKILEVAQKYLAFREELKREYTN